MFLCGEHAHQIDEKGRIRIPVKLKEALGPNPVIMRGIDGCLFMYSQERAAEVFARRFDKADNEFSDPDTVKAKRLMFASALQVEEDKQGRVTLSDNLIKYAGIKKNIVSIGAMDRVEIWSEENWLKYSEIEADAYDSVLKSLK